ncbi:MAG TPA: glycoside hydrolase family 15 protein [Gemmata sp.]|jgi:GH15 family glucan-1,4-alpha-glucosidase|nr:glycoside hydrolase family 15 protein [Gemmata sp.]
MALRIEDYALIGDCQTSALVGKDGSIDWLCLPRFDSGACFAALLGNPEHGRWLVAPEEKVKAIRRRYRPGTLVLETEFETDEGVVALIDFMPARERDPNLVRIVEGRKGNVRMKLELVLRFDYGSIVPWVRRNDYGISAIAGPEAVAILTPIPLQGENLSTVANFTVEAGQRVPFSLSWHRSNQTANHILDTSSALIDTEAWWSDWSRRCTYRGPYRDHVLRSLITLKALTYEPTGGIVAAPTTSLPEQLGGVRNWDYRYCWLRDATLTLLSLINCGYVDDAAAWRRWLLRAVAGSPSETQIMYGLAGERRLTEWEVPWLSGYEGSRPVRVGNAAHGQRQLDVYGELFDALFQAREAGLAPLDESWRVGNSLLEWLAEHWAEPDDGIWEVRGPRQHFVHSKVMAWVAFDRAVQSIEKYGGRGDVAKWKQIRDTIHAEVCEKGFDRKRMTFTQAYGSEALDASVLMIPLVGFLPATDPRVRGTVEAIGRDLMSEGFVMRYDATKTIDGLPPGEGAFLPCTFWYAHNLALLGRRDEATKLFERLLGLCNDVGLLSEEYNPQERRFVGNFPQAFSHIGLIATALNLSRTSSSPTEPGTN